jgi:adenylate cyclase
VHEDLAVRREELEEAALMRGEDQRAHDLAARSVAALPSNPFAHASLGAIDALTGRTEQAALEIANVLKLWPSATVASYDHLQPSANPVCLAQRGRMYEGLRRAGLPEQ